MRLWTLHPRYLDAQGLVALWREALLAQKVLRGETSGYRHHPQLIRFREVAEPLSAIAAYLKGVHEEATKRGYRFDSDKITALPMQGTLDETRGQVHYEWQHLMRKLSHRSPERYAALQKTVRPLSHPLFRLIAGGVRDWERPSSRAFTVSPAAASRAPSPRP